MKSNLVVAKMLANVIQCVDVVDVFKCKPVVYNVKMLHDNVLGDLHVTLLITIKKTITKI